MSAYSQPSPVYYGPQAVQPYPSPMYDPRMAVGYGYPQQRY